MAAAMVASCAPDVVPTQQHQTVVHTAEQHLAVAQQHLAKGHHLEARMGFQEVWHLCRAGRKVQDLWMRAAAGLGYADVALEEGSWPSLEGKSVDEIIEASLDAARQAAKRPKQGRSRALEGQLLLRKSKVLFSKLSKSAADLESAIEARFAAVELMQESAVEALPWSKSQVHQALEQLEGDAQSGSKLLSLEDLLLQIHRRWPDGISLDDEEAVSNTSFLFEAWASPDALSGENVVALKVFLTEFLEVAKRFDRAVDAEPCSSHIPCSGNLPEGREYSAIERELVMIISRDGAGDWCAKAEKMRDQGMAEVTASMLENLWRNLAPVLKESIDVDAQMACGHSCSSCPTRESCQVHDAVKDIDW